MTRTKSKWIYLVPFATLAITIQAHAQGHPYHQYKLTQVGTFGGSFSSVSAGPNNNILNSLNIWGGTVGLAGTSTPDPFAPNCFWDCFVDHALKFQNGALTDLGALPGANSSVSYGINDLGLVVGVSENGKVDPQTGYPEYHAVVWSYGEPRDLGTLGGSVSQAFAANDWGQVVGVAANAVPDPYSNGIGPCTAINCWPVTTQQRAFLWEGGALRDLGTLGGNDAVAYFVNQAGQVAGVSYTNTTANPTTGNPTQHPFLWQNGKMMDLGTLGGTWGVVYSLNNLGQVVGSSNVAGDTTYHPFLWDRGVLTDLGTLGGDAAVANWINDSGEVVGGGWTASGVWQAFLWRHGAMTDLGTVAGGRGSWAYSINAGGQVVGDAWTNSLKNFAMLWENGGPMVDLNALVEPASNPSNLYLQIGYAIANSGEVLAYGVLPNGDSRIAVLVPDGVCGTDCEGRIAAGESARVAAVQAGQAAGATISNAPELGQGAAWRPGLFGPRNLTLPQRSVPQN
jgi:probable HAF family extracellular repeat protein